MSIKVAVLGPKDLADRIVKAGSEFKVLDMVSYAYKSETETMSIINGFINDVDLIIFTGPIPYYIARKNVERDIPMLYVSYSGTAFYKTLFNHLQSIAWNRSMKLKFSIDTIHKRTVEEMLSELDITDYELNPKEYDDYISAGELVQFHYNLYKQGKIDFAITCLTSAYDNLKNLNVPVYRIVPTGMSIRETLKLANLEAINLISKEAQLCVGVVKVLNRNEISNYSPSEYEQKRMGLTMTELFINFCEEIKASMKIENNDEYMFYATRGAIESVTNFYRFMPLIQDINEHLPYKMCIGLGYGYSANEAEKNSREALKHAISYNKNSCYVIMEDGKVRGPLEAGRMIEFYSKAEESQLIEVAQKSKVSVMTLNKILGIMESGNKESITANDIAETLNITLRSARRILSSLEEAGGAVAIGEEQPAGRGRPRQIYKIKL